MQKIEHNSLCETETYKGFTMTEYVDKDELLKNIEQLKSDAGSVSVLLGIKRAEDVIEKQPTVEVVECSNCVYSHFNKEVCAYSCKRRDYYSEFVKPTDFCSYGERK